MSDYVDNDLLYYKYEQAYKEFEQQKRKAYDKAYSMLETAIDFEEIGTLLDNYYSTETLIEMFELYKERNIYYNSPLSKAMREEE